MSNTEIRITGMADVGTALRAMARRLGISISALVDAGGTFNGSLIAVGTGNSRHKDTSIRPILRVLKPAGWELVGRVADPDGLLIKVDRGVPILVRGADGGRLEVSIETMGDVSTLLNTMAAANGITMTSLVARSGSSSSSLVSVATGRTVQADLRLSNLVRITETAQFELVIRPIHATLREARIALARRL